MAPKKPAKTPIAKDAVKRPIIPPSDKKSKKAPVPLGQVKVVATPSQQEAREAAQVAKMKPRATANPTSIYESNVWGTFGYGVAYLDGAPFYTWFDIPRMQRDPRVMFLERMWQSPFQQVTWKVKATNQAVAEYVDRQFTRFWTRSLHALLYRYFWYGFAPGGAEFEHRNGIITLEQVRPVEPYDARPLVYKGGPNDKQLAGMQFGNTQVLAPHAFWFAGEKRFGKFYDRPPAAGMFEPWAEKRMRNGAIAMRRTWFLANSSRGKVGRYPEGETSTTGGETTPRDNKDLMNEMLDNAMANANFALPSTLNPGAPDKYLWDVEWQDSFPDRAGYRDYPKDLDEEMAEGVGIPKEVLEAAQTGSGFSGRAIPMMAWLGSADVMVGLLVASCDWLKYAVQINYGPQAAFEIMPDSLVKKFEESPGAGGAGGSPAPAPPHPGGGTPGGMTPYTGPHGGHGYQNPMAGRVRYLSDGRIELVAEQFTPANDRYLDMDGRPFAQRWTPIPGEIGRRVKDGLRNARQLSDGRTEPGPTDPARRRKQLMVMLAMMEFQRRAHAVNDPASSAPYLAALSKYLQNPDGLHYPLQLSWRADETKTGHVKAVGEAEHAGRVLYGARAEAALRAQEGLRSAGQNTKIPTPHPNHDQWRKAGVRAREILTKFAADTHTPEELTELSQHLPYLPMDRLGTARSILRAQFKGVRGRLSQVNALMDHIREQVGVMGQKATEEPMLKHLAGDAETPNAGTPLDHLAAMHHDPEAMLRSSQDLGTHDAINAAYRGEFGADVKGAVERGGHWNNHGGNLVKKHAAIGKELAALKGQKETPQESKESAPVVPVESKKDAKPTAPENPSTDVPGFGEGGLFNRGDYDTDERPQHIQSLHTVASVAKSLVPGVDSSAHGDTGKYLESLEAVDKEAKEKLGKFYPVNGDAAFERISNAHRSAAAVIDDMNTDSDPKDAEDEIKSELYEAGREIKNGNEARKMIASALRNHGHDELAAFYSSHAASVGAAAMKDLEQVAHKRLTAIQEHDKKIRAEQEELEKKNGEEADAKITRMQEIHDNPMQLKANNRNGRPVTPRDAAVNDLQEHHEREQYLTKKLERLKGLNTTAAQNDRKETEEDLARVRRKKGIAARKVADIEWDEDQKAKAQEDNQEMLDAPNQPVRRNGAVVNDTSGTVPKPAPVAPAPIPASGVHPALAHLDPEKTAREAKHVDNGEDMLLEKAREAELAVTNAKEALRRVGSIQPEKRNAQKALTAAQKAHAEASRAVDDFNRHRPNYNAKLNGVAVDEKQPLFVRIAAARYAMGGNAHGNGITEILPHVQEYLAAHGHDPRIAEAVATDAVHYPLRSARKLNEVIKGEETRQKMYDERKEAREYLKGLDLLPHHVSAAEREAGDLYQGDIKRFKEKWSGVEASTREEKARLAENERKFKEQQAKDNAAKSAADEFIAAHRAGKELPPLDPEAAREVAKNVLMAPTQWHAGTELPKSQNAKSIADQIAKDMGSRFALVKTITDQGWATDAKYAVKATPAMVEHAKAKGYDQVEGRTPPMKDILEQGVKYAVHPAKIVATRVHPSNGEDNVLVQSEDGKQETLSSQYVANIMGLYPDAKIMIAGGAKPVMFVSKGEPVGLVMPLASGDAEEKPDSFSSDPRLKFGDVFEPGPYKPEDIEETSLGLMAGRGEHAMNIRINGRKNGGYTLDYRATGAPIVDREYPTRPEAVAAGKEILAHAQGMDDDGKLIFNAKGTKGSGLHPEEKARVDYYAKLRERTAEAKKAKPKKKADGKEYLPVGEHFGVEKTFDDKGKPDGWRAFHVGTDMGAGDWTTRDAAISHALMMDEVPGADWGTFNADRLPNGPRWAGKLNQNVKSAFENNELPDHAKPPEEPPAAEPAVPETPSKPSPGSATSPAMAPAPGSQQTFAGWMPGATTARPPAEKPKSPVDSVAAAVNEEAKSEEQPKSLENADRLHPSPLPPGDRDLVAGLKDQHPPESRKDLPVQDVPVDSLRGTQDHIDPDKVKSMQGKDDLPPMDVVKDDEGQHHVEDGHHRGAAAIANGDETVPARVWEKGEEGFTPAESKPQPRGMDGKTREERIGKKPEPVARPPLPQRSIDMMNEAITSSDREKLVQMLDPANKGWRAMFEEATGQKLPKTIRETTAVLDRWLASKGS